MNTADLVKAMRVQGVPERQIYAVIAALNYVRDELKNPSNTFTARYGTISANEILAMT